MNSISFDDGGGYKRQGMRLLLTALIGLTLLGGCRERVQVVDPAGRPVEGARVAPVTLSMNGAAEMTDARGEATVLLKIGLQDTKWVNVSKQGFEPQQVNVPAQWPLKVVMRPANQP